MKEKNLEKIRHSLSHLLAQAVKEKFPKVKLGIGPVIENGFYYDFDFSSTEPLREGDLAELEDIMRKNIDKNLTFVGKTITENEAREIFSKEPYKLELIENLKKKDQSLMVYESGNFIDLCSGPHVDMSHQIDKESFHLERIAGAYWLGDEKNKMLTRIYGVAFADKNKLEEYKERKEEALKRDHRKLGKDLDLFCFSEIVGAGLPLFTPNGTMIKDILQKHIEEICRQYGFEKVSTPHLAKIDLYELSGHAKKFGDELFRVSSPAGHNFVLKPVQCPHHTQIYASKPRSYRDLPIRYMESEKQYRAEKTGEVGGLNRVYAITVEDGHTFCRPDQIKEEVTKMINIIKDFYTSLGLWEDHWVSLSVRDYDHPEKYIGEPADWDECEKVLEEISNDLKLEAKRCEGEAALYGPKLDFMFRDALGKEIQIPTVQLDFATPKKFNLIYTDKDGSEKNPIMIHRAILGSYERFMALIIEHFAGAFPTWLSPIQVTILPISDNFIDEALKVKDKLKSAGIRVDILSDGETLGKRLRQAKMKKVPYIVILGEKEIRENNLQIEKRDGQSRKMTTAELIDCILDDN